MERIIMDGVEVDKSVTLAEMKSYLLEWYTNGVVEQLTKFDEVYFEDYDKELTIKDPATGETIYMAVFHKYDNADDNSIVYLSGVMNKELRGIIGKMMDLDAQQAEYEARGKAAREQTPQKGE